MFLRFYEGAKPGKRSNPTKSADEVSNAKRAYEEKRERGFLSIWQKGRSWLVHDVSGNMMYCSTCRAGGVSENESVFVKGTSSYRVDGIKYHEASDCHKSAAEKITANTEPISQSKAAKCLQQLKRAENDRLVILMRNAHAVAKHNLSLKSYEILCKLDIAKGLDVGSTYLNDKSAAMFTESIARTTRADIVEKIYACDFCSFTCDGSTDFTGDDLESLFVRTSTKGVIEDTYMFIGAPDSACSQDIYNYIKEVFHKLKIEDHMKTKLVGFCADGASNMQGTRTGLAALLLRDWPHLVVTHCLAHRLELAFKDAVKASAPKMYEKATTLLFGLYYLYRKSPKEKKGLQRAFDALKIPQILPTRIGGTRWLPHYERAINVFIKAYRVYRFHLENSSHKNPKAEGLGKLLRDGNLIVFILTLKRVIGVAMKLSLYLQSGGLSLADAYARVEATKATLDQVRFRTDSGVSSVVSEGKYQGEHVVFRGQKPNDEKNLDTLIGALLKSLENRFPASKMIASTTIGSFRNWPSPGSDAISAYGEEHIRTLWHHFQSVCTDSDTDVEELLDEWTTLKSLIFEKYSEELKTKMLTCDVVVDNLSDPGTAKVLQLVSILCALPPTSVKNETAFSQMKLLKTKRRGRLQSTRLNDLLTIKLESSTVETFNPEPAILDWMTSTPSGQKRRPSRKAKSLQSSETSQEEDDEVLELECLPATETPIVSTLENQESVFAASSNWLKDVDHDGPTDDADDDDDDDEMEMAEDTVFSLLFSYKE